MVDTAGYAQAAAKRDAAPRLRPNVLSILDSSVFAVAGTAPAYSIAASTAALVGAVGFAGPAALLYCGIPMFGIAWAFNYLNRIETNAGTTFAWVGRVLHPALGFLAGWALIMYALIFMVAGSLPAGSTTLGLFSSSAANNLNAVTAVGAAFFVIVFLVVVRGVRLSVRAQWTVSLIELSILAVFAVWGVIHGATSGVQSFSWSWFGFSHFTNFSGFIAGALIATFYYSGWDVSSNLGEETKDGRLTAGRGALFGMVLIFILFEVFTVAISMSLSSNAIQANSANVFAVFGDRVFSGGGKVLAIAIILSTLGGLEATLIQANRTAYAMARERTLPSFLARIHDRWQTPVLATIVAGGISIALFVASNLIGGSLSTVVTDAISAIGLLIAFYYGLTGVAVVVAYRRRILESWANFVFIGLWPGIGAAFMLWVFGEAIDHSTGGILGAGLGSLALGLIPLALYWGSGKSDYFKGHGGLRADSDQAVAEPPRASPAKPNAMGDPDDA
jgi:amino acid transporter